MWRISYGCLVWGVKHGVLGMGYMVLGVWCGVCSIYYRILWRLVCGIWYGVYNMGYLALGVWYGVWGIIHDVVGMVCLV